MVEVAELGDSDRAWATAALLKAWGFTDVVRLGEAVDPTGLPGFVGLLDGAKAGLLTYAIRGRECEIVTLNSFQRGQGVARAMLDATRDAAVQAGCERLWVITSNDNVRALRIYQQWGFDLVGLHHGAIDETRRTLKPDLAATGYHGIPIAHELELELRL